MQEQLHSRIAKYFNEHEDKKYLEVVKTNQKAKYTQFYLLYVLKKLQSKQDLLSYLLSLKKSESLRVQQLLDALWAISNYLEQQKIQTLTKCFNQFVVQLNTRGLVEKALLMERLNEKTIYECRFAEQVSFQKKRGRAFTKLNFEQIKYNLYREANQGYSKVVLILLSVKAFDDVTRLYKNIVCLIGHFDLDPDRIIDLILQSFIQNPSVKVYTELLKNFERTSIPLLMGEKISRNSLNESNSQKLVTFESVESFLSQSYRKILNNDPLIPSFNLIRVTAILIKRKLLKLEEIVNYLSPNDKFFQLDANKRIEAAQAKFNEAFVVNTQEISDKQKKDIEKQERAQFIGQFLYSTKLWLMCQLVGINDWHHFYEMWFAYSNYFDLINHQPIMKNLFELLEWSLQPLYNLISTSRFMKKPKIKQTTVQYQPKVQTKQILQFRVVSNQFFDQIEDILSVLKGYIGFNSRVFIKLCRLFKKILVQPEIFSIHEAQKYQQYKQRIKDFIVYYMVPGISAQTSNPTLSLELYPLMNLYHYTIRYEAYHKNLTKLMLNNPYYCKQFVKVKKQQNILFNTLAKENKKQYFKRVGKLSHNHCFYVFYWVTRRIMKQDYESMIPEVVNILVNCTKFALDVFVFIILYAVIENKQPVADIKTGDVLGWYKNCYNFLCLFYRKHYETDLMPIFSYILNKLNRSIKQIESNGELQSVELKILKQLICKMYGNSFIDEINKAQLPTLAAGPRLQFEAYYLTSEIKAAKKSKSELENFFWVKSIDFKDSKSLAFYFMVLISQKRSQTVLKSTIGDMKVLTSVYDEYTTALVQFIKVLTFQATDFIHYGKLLPEQCLKLLLLQYKIPIELSFNIVRYSIKNISSMNNEQWNIEVANIKSIMDAYFASSTIQVKGYNTTQNLVQYLSIYKQKFNRYMTYELFSAFWLLTLDCINYPHKIYEEKIDELRKKIQNWKNNEKPEKELQKTKNLFDKINKESQIQNKKYKETMEEKNRNRLIIPKLKLTTDKKADKNDKSDDFLNSFTEIFTQTCILPRLLLEPADALFCAKFVILFIKTNQLNSNRSVKMISFILEYVLSYLPSSTLKQSACISIFLSELLNIFANWNDPQKLKNDFLTKLGTEESLIKDNYAKMRQFLIKLFEKLTYYIKNIKEEPYIIKNALYLLDKLEVIPAFKQQAEQLEQYVKQLKQQYGAYKDMKPLLERHTSLLNTKRTTLPDRPTLIDKPKQKNIILPSQKPQKLEKPEKMIIEDVKKSQIYEEKQKIYEQKKNHNLNNNSSIASILPLSKPLQVRDIKQNKQVIRENRYTNNRDIIASHIQQPVRDIKEDDKIEKGQVRQNPSRIRTVKQERQLRQKLEKQIKYSVQTKPVEMKIPENKFEPVIQTTSVPTRMEIKNMSIETGKNESINNQYLQDIDKKSEGEIVTTTIVEEEQDPNYYLKRIKQKNAKVNKEDHKKDDSAVNKKQEKGQEIRQKDRTYYNQNQRKQDSRKEETRKDDSNGYRKQDYNGRKDEYRKDDNYARSYENYRKQEPKREDRDRKDDKKQERREERSINERKDETKKDQRKDEKKDDKVERKQQRVQGRKEDRYYDRNINNERKDQRRQDKKEEKNNERKEDRERDRKHYEHRDSRDHHRSRSRKHKR